MFVKLVRNVAMMLTSLPCVALAQVQPQAMDSTRTDNLPVDRGQLSLESITVRLTNGNLEVVFIPLDERVLRLLTRESYQAIERTIREQHAAIDSAAQSAGVTDLGLALVSFHGLAQNTRFDPSLLSVVFHGQQFRPAAWVALSPNFSNQQLDLREQVRAFLIFRRDIPVKEPFTLSYLGANNDDWQNRLPRFDSERNRILGARARPDSARPPR